MKRFLSEPLVHFLLIGAGLFVLFGFANKEEQSESTIVVTSGRIGQLSSLFAKSWQRPPTKEELKALIDDFVLEEIYYRQAKEMGIDRDDTIIRRRLRQKLEFLTDDAASYLEASDEELATYLEENADRFRRDSTYSFRQVFINPEKYGDELTDHIASQLHALQAGEAVVGDSDLLPTRFDSVTTRMVDSSLGLGFTAQLDELDTGKWIGPIESGMGLHLVYLESRISGGLPPFDEVRSAVEREWAHEKRLEMRQQLNEKLRKEYEIIIKWPEGKQ